VRGPGHGRTASAAPEAAGHTCASVADGKAAPPLNSAVPASLCQVEILSLETAT
jgi:hypothetical protein